MEPMPTTRQQAQDAVYRYYQKTLRELPEGYALDNSRYGGYSATVTNCGPDPGAPNVPAQYTDERVINAPVGSDYQALIGELGDIWRGWGWRVEERDGFNIPNRFGTGPDGYTLMVTPSPKDAKSRPATLTGILPCFPGDDSRLELIPSPVIISRDDMIFHEPSATPTR